MHPSKISPQTRIDNVTDHAVLSGECGRVVQCSGTSNRSSPTIFEFGKQTEYMEPLVLNIGRTNMLIGYDWLCKHNPVIDWERNEVQIKPVKKLPFKPYEENK